MNYTKNWEDTFEINSSVVTLGKFDGLHRGHKKLIDRVLSLKEKGYTAVIFAFDAANHGIFTKEERRKKLEDMGMDLLVECPLDKKMRHMKAEDFVKEVLVKKYHAAYVVVGEDFRFGFERKGNCHLLEEMGKELGFCVNVIPKEMQGNKKVSSTYVREQLNEGNMKTVAGLLGDIFFVSGRVVHGRGMGHKKLIPTINLIPPKEKLLPPNGVYITVTYIDGQEFKGITNVGYKPTVGGESFIGVETYLFGCNEDLYDKHAVVKFLEFLRPEQKFESLEQLKEQLLKDAKKGKQYFKSIS